MPEQPLTLFVIQTMPAIWTAIESAKNEIIEQVRFLEVDPGAMETPTSVSIDLLFLKQSERLETDR
jgi:hypothetical protein